MPRASDSFYDGWVLVSPSGHVVPETFALTKEACEGLAYDYLSNSKKSKWAANRKYWKQWDLFVRDREARNWTVKEAMIIWDV